MKIKIAVLEKDKIYLERFVSSFSNKYFDKVELYSFTDMDIALETVRESRIDIFIASEAFDIASDEIPKKCVFAYFVESKDIESYKDCSVICKFQRLDIIYKQILGLYAEVMENIAGIKRNIDSNMAIVTFVSASGGTGSSTVAAAYATRLANQGKRVLYLNFEKYGHSGLFFTGEGKSSLSDIVYTVKSKKGNVMLKLESSIDVSPNGVYFLESCNNSMDAMEINEEDIETILNGLRALNSYDVLVLDIDFSLDGKEKLLLKYSDRVVFVSDGTDNSNLKFDRLYDVLLILQQNDVMILNKSVMVYNRFKNNVSKTTQKDINVIGMIPKYAAVNNEQLVGEISNMTFFDNII